MTPHTCTTTLAPGAPWPAYQVGSMSSRSAFVPPKTAGRLTPEQLASDTAQVLTAIAQHGPCCLSRLKKHIGVSRHRVALALVHLMHQQRLAIVRQERWNSNVMSDIFGFLP